jgi:ubiquinone/menaquinone biosynthesis C-methylase UbiE
MAAESSGSVDARIAWESQEVAQHWSRNQARRDKHIGPATETMLDLAGIQKGHRVLDVAAGTGGQTLSAARRVGPAGYVLATDRSAAMLSVAAEAAKKAGFANVETRVMDAERLDLDAASFDAAICRAGLMLFSDPPKALGEIHRVLKPGGKVAALVFSAEAKNPYQGIPSVIVRRLGRKTPPQFSLGTPALLQDAFRAGGFAKVAVHPERFRRHFPSVADVIQNLKDAIFLREAMSGMGDGEREKAWAEIERELGKLRRGEGLELPGEMLIGVGTK